MESPSDSGKSCPALSVMEMERVITRDSMKDLTAAMRDVPVSFLADPLLLSALLRRLFSILPKNQNMEDKKTQRIMTALFMNAIPHLIDCHDEKPLSRFLDFLDKRIKEFGCKPVDLNFDPLVFKPFLFELTRLEECDTWKEFMEQLLVSCVCCPTSTVKYLINLAINYPPMIPAAARVFVNDLGLFTSLFDDRMYAQSFFASVLSDFILNPDPADEDNGLLYYKHESLVKLILEVNKQKHRRSCLNELTIVIDVFLSCLSETKEYFRKRLVSMAYFVDVVLDQNLEGKMQWRETDVQNFMFFGVSAIKSFCTTIVWKRKVVHLINRIMSHVDRRVSKEDLEAVKLQIMETESLKEQDLFCLMAYFDPFLERDLNFIEDAIPFCRLPVDNILLMASILKPCTRSWETLKTIVISLDATVFHKRLKGTFKFLDKHEMSNLFIFLTNYFSKAFVSVAFIKVIHEIQGKLEEQEENQVNPCPHLISYLEFCLNKNYMFLLKRRHGKYREYSPSAGESGLRWDLRKELRVHLEKNKYSDFDVIHTLVQLASVGKGDNKLIIRRLVYNILATSQNDGRNPRCEHPSCPCQIEVGMPHMTKRTLKEVDLLSAVKQRVDDEEKTAIRSRY